MWMQLRSGQQRAVGADATLPFAGYVTGLNLFSVLTHVLHRDISYLPHKGFVMIKNRVYRVFGK